MPKYNYKVPTYPVPILSKKNVEFINSIIDEKKIDFIIEYGSGYSTMYFIKNLKSMSMRCTILHFCCSSSCFSE